MNAFQDHETADAIGSKSYNTLMGELVSLETKSIMTEEKKNSEDDSVDFVAATTAALGIPSPSLSRGQSFNDSPQQARKGDIEEEEELLRALRLSEMENSDSTADGVVPDAHVHESVPIEKCELVTHPEVLENDATAKPAKPAALTSDNDATAEPAKPAALSSDDSNALGNLHVDPKFPEVVSEAALSPFTQTDEKKLCAQLPDEESSNIFDNVIGSDTVTLNGMRRPVSLGQFPLPVSNDIQHNHVLDQITTTSNPDAVDSHNDGKDSSPLNGADSDSSSGQMYRNDEPEPNSSSVDSEPIYEGEDRILDLGTVVDANREPMYEGEVVLAEQVDAGCVDDGNFSSKDIISMNQGEIAADD